MATRGVEQIWALAGCQPWRRQLTNGFWALTGFGREVSFFGGEGAGRVYAFCHIGRLGHVETWEHGKHEVKVPSDPIRILKRKHVNIIQQEREMSSGKDFRTERQQ